MKEFKTDWLQATITIFVVSLYNINTDKIEQQQFSENEAEALKYAAELERTSDSNYKVWTSREEHSLIPVLKTRTSIIA